MKTHLENISLRFDLVTIIALSSKVDTLSQKQFHSMTLYERTDGYLYLFVLNLLHYPTTMDHLKNLISWSKNFLHYFFRATLRNLEPTTILK